MTQRSIRRCISQGLGSGRDALFVPSGNSKSAPVLSAMIVARKIVFVELNPYYATPPPITATFVLTVLLATSQPSAITPAPRNTRHKQQRTDEQ